MPVIDSTPEFVTNAYATMRRNLEVVRRRLDRPMGLADKLLLSHLDEPDTQEMVPGRTVSATRVIHRSQVHRDGSEHIGNT